MNGNPHYSPHNSNLEHAMVAAIMAARLVSGNQHNATDILANAYRMALKESAGRSSAPRGFSNTLPAVSPLYQPATAAPSVYNDGYSRDLDYLNSLAASIPNRRYAPTDNIYSQQPSTGSAFSQLSSTDRAYSHHENPRLDIQNIHISNLLFIP